MDNHPIENIMGTTMENLNQMIDVDKVIGQAVIAPSGATIIPVSSLCFGFISGGGEFETSNAKAEKFPFAGGSGAGVSVKPTGFLVLTGESVKFLPIQKSSSCDRLIELVPEIVDKVKCMCSEQNDDAASSEDDEA